MNSNEPQQQQQPLDLVSMQQQIVGLQNQRNAAFNDAAELFGKLQSSNNTINSLLSQLQATSRENADLKAKLAEYKSETSDTDEAVKLVRKTRKTANEAA